MTRTTKELHDAVYRRLLWLSKKTGYSVMRLLEIGVLYYDYEEDK